MDLTDTISFARKVASQEERDTEALHQFLYLMPAMMYVKCYSEELSSGRYVFVSREWERTYSLKRNQVIGKTDYDLFPRKEADKMRLDDVHTMEFGKATTLSDGAGTRYSGWKPIKMALIPLKVNGDAFNYIAGMALSTSTVSLDV